MRRLNIRCHNCGSRAEIVPSDFEDRNLRARGYLTRFCRECRSNTQWDPQEQVGATKVADAEASEFRGRILTIDDDESILTILEKALTRERFDVQTASSARDAINLLARGDYDLIISDIRMPDFDGQQLFTFLEEHLPEHRQRVIFLTADIRNPKTLEFLDQVERPYLGKPIDLPALVAMINRHFERVKAAKEREARGL